MYTYAKDFGMLDSKNTQKNERKKFLLKGEERLKTMDLSLFLWMQVH